MGVDFSSKCVRWLREKVRICKTDGLVIGLSGGIDSAVVSVLCKKAFPKDHLCLILPCKSSSEDRNFALKHARKFDLRYKVLSLDKPFDALCRLLPKGSPLSIANLKPRLRMLTLYYHANNLNYLVVGTGNRSEISVGYFTKYGDGGVDILPIGSLLKREVYRLAEEMKIDGALIDRQPSAGLWDGQTDEEEMGLRYCDLDASLSHISKNGPLGLSMLDCSKKVLAMVRCSEHKRNLPEIFKY